MQKISAVIITYNEEQRIVSTLESLAWCDEIIIVDSCSTDKTVEICKTYSNCKVYIQPFLGYGSQKKFAVEKTTNDWVLSIDADEIVSDELKNEIERKFASDSLPEVGFYVPITLIFMKKIFKHGALNKNPHLRLFNKTKGCFNTLELHEGIDIDGQLSTLTNEIFHFSYIDIHHYFSKFNNYTTIYKNEAVKKEKKVSMFKPLLRFPLEFSVQYFIRCNFLNGYPGFVWALFSSFYVFVKYTKIYETSLSSSI